MCWACPIGVKVRKGVRKIWWLGFSLEHKGAEMKYLPIVWVRIHCTTPRDKR